MKKNKPMKVRQSNHLIESPYSQEFSIHEIKLFEIALAECKQEDIKLFESETNKKFKFSSAELAKLLNTSVSTISHEIEKTAARIMKKTIHLRKVLPDGSVEFEMINIMPYTKYKNGILEFQINYQIIPYLVELNSNFTEFHLDNLLIMNSSYGIKLYKLLYQYKNIKHRAFNVDDLKNQFGLIDKYPLYSDFKRRILEPSVLQINTNTDLNVEYSEIKLGRRVEKLQFKFSIKKEDILIKDENSTVGEVSESIANIEKLLGVNSDDVSEKNKLNLTNLMLKKGVNFIDCSIQYAKKNAKTNFEKYLLDTIENNWAEIDIQKIELKLEKEEIEKQNKVLKIKENNKQIESDNANKSEIEHLFLKLSDTERDKYVNLTHVIFNKHASKLEEIHCNTENLIYSVYAVSNGRYYNKTLEIYISKMLNRSLNINDYKS